MLSFKVLAGAALIVILAGCTEVSVVTPTGDNNTVTTGTQDNSTNDNTTEQMPR